MNIRDINQVIELETEVFGESLGYDMLYREVVENETAKYYIYEENAELIGYLGTWQQEDYAEIVNFLINPSFQSKGFGKKILNEVLLDMKSNKIAFVTLDVREGNQRAIALYKSLGFEQKHIRKEYYSNKENALIMVKQM